MCRCSYPPIASLGIVFEIKEYRNLPWNIAPNWLWYHYIRRDTEARREFLSSSELSLLTLSWKVALVHPFRRRMCRPLPHSSAMEPTFSSS